MMDPFVSAKALFNRANAHIQEFQKAVATYQRSQPFDASAGPATTKGYQLLKARVKWMFRPQDVAIVFDAVNCLRSSLDHAVFDAARVLGGEPNPKYTKFPMAKSKADAQHDLRRKGAEVPPELQPYLLAFEPFEGGKERLWELNELRNGKIHRILSETIFRLETVGFPARGGRGLESFEMGKFINEWNAESQELVLFEFRTPTGGLPNIAVGIDVVFGPDTPFALQSAAPLLVQLAEVVRGVILGIEAETARLGKA